MRTETAQCSVCGKSLPNYLGAVNLGKLTLCTECFGKGLRQTTSIESRETVFLRLVDPELLGLVKAQDERLRKIVSLALTFSSQEADKDGIFSNPSAILRRAYKTVLPNAVYDYNLVQRARNLLFKQEFWLPVGIQRRGAGNKNQMLLGPKVREIG